MQIIEWNVQADDMIPCKHGHPKKGIYQIVQASWLINEIHRFFAASFVLAIL